MKIVKCVFAIAIVSVLLFGGGVKMSFRQSMFIGNDLNQICCNERVRLIDKRGTLAVVEDEVSYCYLISEDGIKVTSSARFNCEGKIIAVMGVEVLEITKNEIEIPDSINEMMELYGEPHVDIGSGFYIPCYILSDASILVFYTTDERVTDMRVYSYLN